MSRLPPIQINGKSLAFEPSLKIAPLKLADAPRFLQVMANSPAALRAYILADAALLRGELTRRQRQQVALAVAEINGSTYSLSALDATGKPIGLTKHEMQSPCNAVAADPKTQTMLSFTQAVVLQRGEVSDEDFQTLVKAGFTNAQIIEIVANIALNIFFNYFNSVVQTEMDFPVPRPGMESPRVAIPHSNTRPPKLGAGSPKPHLNRK
jgi:alkylhydroperoxidase family enzyme